MTSVERVPADGSSSALTRCEDDFADDVATGGVIGSTATSGAVRRGIDAESLLAVDNGALRMRPLARPGWAREGVSYGPFTRVPGLAFAAHVLNGHNASQTYYQPETAKQRARRWLSDARRGRLRRPHHYESLAVGWFPSEAPSEPTRTGNGFVMHAATADNGELWSAVKGVPMRLALGVQNLQILYVVVLRERGAAYYAASVPEAQGLGPYPQMRPLAIDPDGGDPVVYGGVHQRILGEVGYRVDTRVYGVRAEVLRELSAWYGTADRADTLRGTGALAGSQAEVGGPWLASEGRLERSEAGVGPVGDDGGAALLPGSSGAGLVHVVFETGRHVGHAGLLWRATGAGAEDSGWGVTVGADGCRLAIREQGHWKTVEVGDQWRARPRSVHSLQVSDDGLTFGVYLDGRLVFDRWIVDGRLSEGTAAGVRFVGSDDGRLHHFEVHPRQVPVPPQLDLGPPWAEEGTADVFDETFGGDEDDLHGHAVTSGGRTWERTLGSGVIQADGRVRADRHRPNPGRTVYTIPWDEPGFADVSVEMTQPGTRQHEAEAGRGGITFWQDPDNYLVVNLFLDDTFDGASISSFYHLRGQEVMYDAVWTLVRGVTWGERNTLRVVFDGKQFLAFLDGRPSLYRALTDVYPDASPLEIRRVGLIVNWEWGDDTGTKFHRFGGRRRDA